MPVMTTPPTTIDGPDAAELTVNRGEIRFENVHFAYKTGKPVIDGLSLRVRPGEKVGLVGLSGAGKTTLVSLLLRFYDICDGAIDRQTGHPRGRAGKPSPRDRGHRAGRLAFAPFGRRQHPLRPARGDAGRDRTGGKDGKGRCVHCRSARAARALTPSSATAASSSPVASARLSPLRVSS
ncbi:hypothetical protein ACVJBD_005454 [Rhizobium mongolense]